MQRVLNRKELERLQAEDDLTIDGLVDSAEALLRAIAPKQTRYKVRARPDVRTIRYYVSQKLLPKAAGYEGGRARYTGTHLLRLLLIKRLQVEHWTLQRIARAIKGLDDDRIIERLLELTEDARRPKVVRAAPTKTKTPRPSAAEAFEPSPRERIDLGHGAAIDLPQALMTDPAQKEALATRLESFAAWLREPRRTDDEED